MTGNAYTNAIFTVRGSRDSPYSDFMGQSDKASPYSVFMEQSDRTSPFSVSTVRLSETHLEVSDLSDAAWNTRQGVKPGNKLLRGPETSRGVLQGLNKASAF